MKKSIILLIAVVLLSFWIASCDEGVTHLGHSYEYIVYETGHFKHFTCGCPSPDILEEHYDHDSNDVCDVCGCPLPTVLENHYDHDGDGKCDECNYQMLAEGNHFIRNQAGAEWLKEINVDDITEIKMISGGGGPLPPVSFTYISSSTDKAVISSIFEEYYWLDSKPASEEDTQIPDGGYFIVQFILNNGAVKKLYFINGEFFHDGNGNYFEIVRLPVFRDGTNFVNHYGFEIWDRECSVYLADGLLVAVIPTDELEFIELTDDIYLGGHTPTHYIEMNGEKIYFLSEYYFYINDDRSTYYQLVGKTLTELIAEYVIFYD